MNLTEIKLIPKNISATFKLPQNAIDWAVFVGKSENRKVFSSSFQNNGEELYVFFNKDGQGLSSYILVKEIEWNNRDVAVIKRTWTRDNLQKRGYLSGLIKFLRDNYKLSIMSDEEQTPFAREFWKSLEKRFDVKTADLKSNTLIQRVSDDELYSLKNATDFRLFLESSSTKKEIKEWVEPVLPNYNYFEDGDY